jgi:hypothetical protein
MACAIYSFSDKRNFAARFPTFLELHVLEGHSAASLDGRICPVFVMASLSGRR